MPKIRPYFVKMLDTWILGLSSSRDLCEFRIGINLIFFELGILFTSEKLFSYGCGRCGAIGHAKRDELPEGWEKKYRKDSTYYFRCDGCIREKGPDLLRGKR